MNPMNAIPTAEAINMNMDRNVFGEACEEGIIPNSNIPINESGLREYLFAQGFTLGLQTLMLDNLRKIPIRYFICDDSGSMASNDGQRVIGDGYSTKIIPCSRWSEMNEALRFHINLSHSSRAPSEFRFLNSSQPIMIGLGDNYNDVHAKDALLDLLQGSPGGGTPLCRHIREVAEKILIITPELRSKGQKAVLVIFTDGKADDGRLTEAMRPLKTLPVTVVIRLCTDEKGIIDYWNNVDAELEINMDVLDDFESEAKECYAHNKWLTYGMPIQRTREFGVHIKEFDLLDETKLNLEQVRIVSSKLFNINIHDIVNPEENFQEFLNKLKYFVNIENLVFDPVKKRMNKWIDINQIDYIYNRERCRCIIV